MTGRSSPRDRSSRQSSPSNNPHHSVGNVLSLLARREISPRTKDAPKKCWGEASKKSSNSSSLRKSAPIDPNRGLISWIEAESLRHLSAKYCPLVPSPKSTIAAAFNPDGRTLASTHGDHTVKVIDCQTGNCLKVLSGHRRTPWVVRFHPLHPEILVSGSLDYEVRLWNANTSECIGSHDFYRPIASLAFHPKGELLAVASGHKLYMWYYNETDEVASSPSVVLRTKRSLRAVHFHPNAAPFLLTAEVNDLDSSDISMTRATSAGYVRYPPPAVYVANVDSNDRNSLGAEKSATLPSLIVRSTSAEHSRIDLQQANTHAGSRSMEVESSASLRRPADSGVTEQNNREASPMETFPAIPSGLFPGTSDAAVDAMETDEVQPVWGSEQSSATLGDTNHAPTGPIRHISSRPEFGESGQLHQFLPFRDPTCWELPFLQGLLMGQSQASVPSSLPFNGSSRDVEAPVASTAIPSSPRPSGRSDRRHRISLSRPSVSESGEITTPVNAQHDGTNNQPIISRIQSELATSLAAAAAAELPCTVKLRVWQHYVEDSCALLTVEKCCLTIPHAVLCSEMGAHFSPCGRFLAACVACMLPHVETDPGLQTFFHQDSGAATSPTRHPISAHHVMYELRIYSLEEATFGSVLISRAIRAAHCLTSIQFSPTSEHILLAYGRRHGSLLKSIVIDGETTSPIYTVLEIYRVSDMELVRVLPSAEDEVNVACFHPFAGRGLAYGTKEGKLRLLQYDGAPGANGTEPSYFPEENVAESQSLPLRRELLNIIESIACCTYSNPCALT
ncbi:uncharacterized protein LOC120007553 isoform X1 [Tripterygium wilfordii]|uniref:uncharacterized protein LOC120007553 isoform X1 n=1 Tax=Tripterygium wilfordii TaxID=458696 RepID=UPI0018F80745|nr:uncharacterized protein LOC120007553 isoform X1 [Tripterygium wilfordii]